MASELNLPKILYQVTGTFEFELLIELLLRNFEHPLAYDSEYRNTVVESVAEILNRASQGEAFGSMQPSHTNIVYSVWWVESRMIVQESEHKVKAKRRKFLDAMKRSLPSCFCDQDQLG